VRVLGIDPGLNTTGYDVLDFACSQRPVEVGIILRNPRIPRHGVWAMN
jgi:Holliday junction resolvasome RuvABC endonuclease subunit